MVIRILHVDDDPDYLEITKVQLEHMADDVQVECVETAGEAIELLSRGDIDVVVSDYQMPRMDGLAFLQALRDGGNRTPFIFMTGKGDEQLAVGAIDAGADDYQTKGLGAEQFEHLLQSIRRIVCGRD